MPETGLPKKGRTRRRGQSDREEVSQRGEDMMRRNENDTGTIGLRLYVRAARHYVFKASACAKRRGRYS
jgi:hypothetical protein